MTRSKLTAIATAALVGAALCAAPLQTASAFTLNSPSLAASNAGGPRRLRRRRHRRVPVGEEHADQVQPAQDAGSGPGMTDGMTALAVPFQKLAGPTVTHVGIFSVMGRPNPAFFRSNVGTMPISTS